MEYLRAIAENPEVRAEELAALVRLEKRIFKPRVRRLKELGLDHLFEPRLPPLAAPRAASPLETRRARRSGPSRIAFRPPITETPPVSAGDVTRYIIPPMSGMPPPPPPPSFSGTSATIASVVRMFLAIDAAFCSAERVTMAGSMTPAATRSTISPVAALRPWPALALRTSLTTTEPSRPAFSAI